MQQEPTQLTLEFKKIDEKLAIAEEKGSDIEIRDVLIEKAELYLKAGDNDNFHLYYLKAIQKTALSQKKLEFYLIIVNSYFRLRNYNKLVEYLNICKTLNEEVGDWEKKNKINLYEGLLLLIRR